MEGLHGWDEACDEEFVCSGENFVSDEDSDDVGCMGVRDDVGSHPLLGEVELGELGDLVDGDSDGDGDPSVGECTKHLWVGVEESDTVDDGGVEQESSHLERRREVVGHGAVVDTDCCLHTCKN